MYEYTRIILKTQPWPIVHGIKVVTPMTELTLLHSERPELYIDLAFLSAKGLKDRAMCLETELKGDYREQKCVFVQQHLPQPKEAV